MLEVQPATFEEFQREAQRGNVVPVVRTMLADLHTPVGALLRLSENAEHAFLLESIEGAERVARYSFIGANPWMIVRGHGGKTIVERDDAREEHQRNAIDFVRDYFKDKKLARRPGLAPLAGGAVGYLGYDAASWFEPILSVNGNAGQTDEAVWVFFRNIVAFDRVRQQMEITALVFTTEANGDAEKLRALYERALTQTANIEKTLGEQSGTSASEGPGKGDPTVHFQSNWPRKEFESAVEKVKAHIAAGDCYQVVIAQIFTKPTPAQPLAIYRALRATNPAPYMYFLRMGEQSIIGASPEMLVRCHGQRLDYRPIAGTRKRGATEAVTVSFASLGPQ
jgi:anthranilate synthase component I